MSRTGIIMAIMDKEKKRLAGERDRARRLYNRRSRGGEADRKREGERERERCGARQSKLGLELSQSNEANTANLGYVL